MNNKILLINPKILQICSYEEFEPVIYDHGKGFEGDILRAIAKYWDVKISFTTNAQYENIWEKPEKEGFDIAAGGISPQKDRKTHAIYSLPTASYSQSLLIRKADFLSGNITGYESFKENLYIGVVKGSAGEKYGHIRAKEVGVDNQIFKQYKSESELLPALLEKEIAAIARGDIGNEYQAAKNKELITIAHKNFDEQFCFAVDAERKKFLLQLNKAIKIVTHSGRLSYKEWIKNRRIFNI